MVHLDTDPEPQEASARSPGTIWVGNRAPGLELRLAVTARERWRSLAALAPGVGFRSDGSITVATESSHLQVFDALLARVDADERGLRFLASTQMAQVNPALQGEQRGGLWCSLDAVVEPRLALSSLRDQILEGDGYEYLGGRQVWEVGPRSVVDTNGRVHRGDAVIACTGARSSVLTEMLTARAPLRRVKVQLMQTAPLGEDLLTLITDGDSLRYSASCDQQMRDLLPAPDPVVEEFGIQVSCVQRSSGALTVGDTHEFEEPFTFDLSERPFDHVGARVEQLLGRPLPTITRRWAGVYLQCTDDRLWYREQVDTDVMVVTGAGQRGLTLSPVIAADTFDFLEHGVDSGGSEPSAGRDGG